MCLKTFSFLYFRTYLQSILHFAPTFASKLSFACLGFVDDQRTCSAWRTISQKNVLWKPLCFFSFPSHSKIQFQGGEIYTDQRCPMKIQLLTEKQQKGRKSNHLQYVGTTSM